MSDRVEIVRVEPQTTAVVRRRASMAELATAIPEMCGEAWDFASATPGLDPGRHLALYLNDLMDIECGVEVARPFEGNGRVVCSATPAGTAATVAHFGPYHMLPSVHDALARWCADNGHELAGPSWELYGHWDDDPAKLRTDVYYLLREAGSR